MSAWLLVSYGDPALWKFEPRRCLTMGLVPDVNGGDPFRFTEPTRVALWAPGGSGQESRIGRGDLAGLLMGRNGLAESRGRARLVLMPGLRLYLIVRIASREGRAGMSRTDSVPGNV